MRVDNLLDNGFPAEQAGKTLELLWDLIRTPDPQDLKEELRQIATRIQLRIKAE